MDSHPPLSDLIERTLQEISKLGLCSELNNKYRRIYKRLKAFAKNRNQACYSAELLRCFFDEAEQRYRAGIIGRARRNLLKRAALLLEDCLQSGRIEWRVHKENTRPMPASEEFLRLYAQYLDNRKSAEWSKNTMESARRLIRQFLVFLDDNGCRSLSETSARMLPSFFQHLLSRYQPTSMQVVAFHLRAFLKFADGGERLLPLVPSNCLRNKAIIPVLSDQEHAALKRALADPEIPLRDRAVIQLALRTGLRSIDIVGIKLSDIDWVNDTILVAQSKTGRPFRIPLTADVGNLLSAYILTERFPADTPYVFLRSQAPYLPIHRSTCYAFLCKVLARAGIRVGDERKGLHVLRHSVASRMLSAGVPVTTIASALGHADKTSTDVYLATDEGRMRECALPLPEPSINIGG